MGYEINYWFKKEKQKELLKGKTIRECAEDIGINRPYLNNVLNKKMPVKHKAVAYAITKYTNKDYEIEDVFSIKSL